MKANMSIVQRHDRSIGCGCAANGASSARTVGACLERDHREIDAVLKAVESFIDKGDFTATQTAFSEFRRRLDAHIDTEEEILFPVYEQLSACDAPTHVMLGEHADIRRLMATIANRLHSPGASPPVEELGALARLLNVHNTKEERILYPESDAAFELDWQRAALVARIEERLVRGRAG
jgi:iron-sulfur cluster repair protein YtfE (RIC family)